MDENARFTNAPCKTICSLGAASRRPKACIIVVIVVVTNRRLCSKKKKKNEALYPAYVTVQILAARIKPS